MAMHVPSRRRRRGEAVPRAGGDRDPRQQPARPDGGEVDAEEELVNRDLALPRGPATVIRGRAPRAAAGGSSVVRADVAADRAAVAHLDIGDRRDDLGHDRPRLDSDEATIWEYVVIAPIVSVPSPASSIPRSSSSPFRSTSMSGDAARAFMTLINI